MQHQYRPVSLTLLALAACAFTGCGGPFDAAVSGVVTLDGVAVPGGTVTFNPVQGGPAAYARIDEDGAYTVQTGSEAGLPSGEYQVTVSANEPPTTEQISRGGPPPSGKPITPLWYRLKDTSGLRFTVQPGNNEFDLKLTSVPPPGWNARQRR
jgi:hypothetical protein